MAPKWDPEKDASRNPIFQEVRFRVQKRGSEMDLLFWGWPGPANSAKHVSVVIFDWSGGPSRASGGAAFGDPF